MPYDWTQPNWTVIQTDGGVLPALNDVVKFGPEGGEIQILNKHTYWGLGCHYFDEYGGQVKLGNDVYEFTRVDRMVTCKRISTASVQSLRPPTRASARRKRGYGSADPPPPTWTAQEGG